jgi:hypothetical protein
MLKPIETHFPNANEPLRYSLTTTTSPYPKDCFGGCELSAMISVKTMYGKVLLPSPLSVIEKHFFVGFLFIG